MFWLSYVRPDRTRAEDLTEPLPTLCAAMREAIKIASELAGDGSETRTVLSGAAIEIEDSQGRVLSTVYVRDATPCTRGIGNAGVSADACREPARA